MKKITRRSFLGTAALVPAALVVDPVVADGKLCSEVDRVALGEGCEHVHVGFLLAPLLSGRSAMVRCPNPYHPGCHSEYMVHAGKFVSEVQPWPVGHPVAFVSVDGYFVTVGW